MFRQGIFCDTPLIIHVNDPYYNPDQSYIPRPETLSSTQPVKNKKSIPLSKQVSSFEASTPSTETTSSLSLDYELSTGFNYDELTNKITVFDGNYDNLSNKPSIPVAQVQSDWSETTGLGVILNKPSLFSGAYADLSGKPPLFSGAYTDLSGKPNLFSGSYTDLTNKPTIPTVQINSETNLI